MMEIVVLIVAVVGTAVGWALGWFIFGPAVVRWHDRREE